MALNYLLSSGWMGFQGLRSKANPPSRIVGLIFIHFILAVYRYPRLSYLLLGRLSITFSAYRAFVLQFLFFLGV